MKKSTISTKINQIFRGSKSNVFPNILETLLVCNIKFIEIVDKSTKICTKIKPNIISNVGEEEHYINFTRLLNINRSWCPFTIGAVILFGKFTFITVLALYPLEDSNYKLTTQACRDQCQNLPCNMLQTLDQ